MWPDRVSNPGPLIYESGALLTALRGPAGAWGSCKGMLPPSKIIEQGCPPTPCPSPSCSYAYEYKIELFEL